MEIAIEAERRISCENRLMKHFRNCVVVTATVTFIAYLATGMHFALYSPQRSNTYLWGVYHVHSSMSDGLQTAKEIALQAHASGVSLVLLTDHGSPNQASSSFRETI